MDPIETIRLRADELAVALESSRPKGGMGLLIEGERGFERYHGLRGKKVWDASGARTVSLFEAIERAMIVLAMRSASVNVNASWVVSPSKTFAHRVRFSKRDIQDVEETK